MTRESLDQDYNSYLSKMVDFQPMGKPENSVRPIKDSTHIDPLISAADDGMVDKRPQRVTSSLPVFDNYDMLSVARAEGEGMVQRTRQTVLKPEKPVRILRRR